MRKRTDVTKRPPSLEPLAHLLAARAGLAIYKHFVELPENLLDWTNSPLTKKFSEAGLSSGHGTSLNQGFQYSSSD